jgi:epoxide hydrolase
VTPFTVEVPEAELDDLRERLDRTRWPDDLPGPGYGIPGDVLRPLAAYWRDGYDWRAAEARLNAWPQFRTTIDGARIHFAHLRSPAPDATPLLLLHGWPSSIVEFTDLAGPLLDSFHLVIPSLPGFGFSGPTPEPGWEPRRISAAFAVLMGRLGYDRYGVHGGDWGAAIARELGRTRPEVLGVHVTLLPGAYRTTPPDESTVDPRELASYRRYAEYARERQGYADIQSTRPQTLAYGLTDSPVGQLAWIAEKFHEWTETPVDRDVLLTTVMLYWLTRTAGSSAALYYERAHASYWGSPPEPSTAPTAVAHFPRENFVLLRRVAAETDTIVRWTDHARGGHFPALENPTALTHDIHTFFASLSGGR